MNTKLTFGPYTWVGHRESWFFSEERYPVVGDVRQINGKLFTIYRVESPTMWAGYRTVHWIPVGCVDLMLNEEIVIFRNSLS